MILLLMLLILLALAWGLADHQLSRPIQPPPVQRAAPAPAKPPPVPETLETKSVEGAGGGGQSTDRPEE